jgi:hypothetical protein
MFLEAHECNTAVLRIFGGLENRNNRCRVLVAQPKKTVTFKQMKTALLKAYPSLHVRIRVGVFFFFFFFQTMLITRVFSYIEHDSLVIGCSRLLHSVRNFSHRLQIATTGSVLR